MRTIHHQTIFPTSAQRVWPAMLSPATFLYACKGLFSVPALAGRVEPFREGESGTAWLFALHVVPAYRHTIEVHDIDPATHTVRTREHGGILRAWNHTLHVEAIDNTSCRYTDTVDIDAGIATGLAALVADGIFRYRQRRWRTLVRRHLLPEGTAYGNVRVDRC
ncbi:hypothetical protein EV580_3835 [Mycobacterium sp. BK086]|uniref:hypothetical protein n=1 Tax=Mycobacterium sp. BK086 TaxID=2512165 RepID=UPI0010600CEF|nr:hypothetical protein [Mycobacterium sp. BK086]TDO12109.1 hypothetical protein EV580_3835 [Mycobacterium sp. BK086]